MAAPPHCSTPARSADAGQILALLRTFYRLGIGLRPGPGLETVELWWVGSRERWDIPPTLTAEATAVGLELRQLVDAERALAARCAALTRLPYLRPAIPGPGWQGYLDVIAAGCATTAPPRWTAGIALYVHTVTAALDAVEVEARRESHAGDQGGFAVPR